MCSTLAITACYVFLVSAAVLSAPLTDKNNAAGDRSPNSPSEAADQEKDLQNLLNLVHKESHQDGVVVHKQEVSHFESNNGQKVQVQAKEEKVLDKNTGKLIADVKQEVKQESAGQGTKPETVVETKVDIPSEGVHETFLQEGETGDEPPSEGNSDLETVLTPSDMAEYLFLTQRFSAFYQALERLVNESKMSPLDAELYTRDVALEYDRLQLQNIQDSIINEKRFYSQVPQEVDEVGGQNLYLPSSQDLSAAPADAFDSANEYGLRPSGYINSEDQFRPQLEEVDVVPDIDPADFLTALWREAYGRGNEEAQEIVRMLYDRVSQDNNPDDMGQIRELLADTIMATMNEESINPQEEQDQPLELPVVPEPLSQQPLSVQNSKTPEQAKVVKVTAQKSDQKLKQKEEKSKEIQQQKSKADQQKQ